MQSERERWDETESTLIRQVANLQSTVDAIESERDEAMKTHVSMEGGEVVEGRREIDGAVSIGPGDDKRRQEQEQEQEERIGHIGHIGHTGDIGHIGHTGHTPQAQLRGMRDDGNALPYMPSVEEEAELHRLQVQPCRFETLDLNCGIHDIGGIGGIRGIRGIRCIVIYT